MTSLKQPLWLGYDSSACTFGLGNDASGEVRGWSKMSDENCYWVVKDRRYRIHVDVLSRGCLPVQM